MKNIKLSNGVEIPIIGLGTYTISPDDAQRSVREALKMGYRLIDTANVYSNEKAVGRGIIESGINRDEVFISSKIWVSEYNNENAVESTLERLGIDYIDLLFIHQPVGDYISGYKIIEKAYKEGKVRSIGISNFYGKDLEKVLNEADVKPQVVQVERHPYYTGKDINDVLNQNDIKVMAWYPLGHGDKKLLNEPIFMELGEKYIKTPVQIILRWHIQMGYIVIPGSKNVDHIYDNFNIFDFELSDEDMVKIANLDKEKKYFEANFASNAYFNLIKPKYEE